MGLGLRLLGADGRVSTSKSTLWLWTLGLVYVALYLTGIQIFVRPTGDVFGSGIWDDYLILAGAPSAAAVLAKYTVVSKILDGSLAKSVLPDTLTRRRSGVPNALSAKVGEAAAPVAAGAVGSVPAVAAGDGGSTGLSDVVAKDTGGIDLVDSQYFLFNLVAFAYAAGIFIAHNFDHAVTKGKYVLPAIPGVLLALTGAAAATYVGNKTAQTTGPRIAMITRGTVAGVDALIVGGVSLVPPNMPSGTAAAQTAVWFVTEDNSVTPTSLTPLTATPTRITCAVPAGFAGKTAQIFVARLDGGVSPAFGYTIA